MTDPRLSGSSGAGHSPAGDLTALTPSAAPQTEPPVIRTPVNPLAVLAYDSAKERLKSQDATLGNLRTRSTTLLSSAAVLTTVAAAVGLLYTDPSKGSVLQDWASWTLMVLVAVNGLCAMSIVWPTSDWAFVPSPKTLLDYIAANEDETAARLGMVEEIARDRESNDAKLDFRIAAFRIQVAALIIEVLVLVFALMRLGPS